jgi:hypothetical protein
VLQNAVILIDSTRITAAVDGDPLKDITELSGSRSS